MTRAIGISADLKYMPSLIALINSILYFGVRAKIKLYDFNGLPHLVRGYLGEYTEIVPPPAAAFGDHYRANQNFRPRILSEVGIAPYEILVDADTVVLSDLEEAFQEVERGHLVVVREWVYAHAERDREQKPVPDENVLHSLLEHPEIYKDKLPIYNAGFLGFNQEKHRFLLDRWARSTHDNERLLGTLFGMEQNKLAAIIASLLRDGKITLHELPPEVWMGTWDFHKTPKKLVGFENGRIALYNGTVDQRMRFYHHTGGIVVPEEIDPECRYAVRFNYLVSDVGVPPELSQSQMVDAWHQVWRERHESPAGELPIFFYEHGPLRPPRCLDRRFREGLARLLRSFQGDATIDADARKTWALALAHDYIDYGGHRAGDLGWMAAPLAAFLDPDQLETGEATLAWGGGADADVVMAFQAGYDDVVDWTGGEHSHRSCYTEHHQGVFLDIR